MTGPDLVIIADILEELKLRWPPKSQANSANVRSFLAFRLRQRGIKNVDYNKRFINWILTKDRRT